LSIFQILKDFTEKTRKKGLVTMMLSAKIKHEKFKDHKIFEFFEKEFRNFSFTNSIIQNG